MRMYRPDAPFPWNRHLQINNFHTRSDLSGGAPFLYPLHIPHQTCVVFVASLMSGVLFSCHDHFDSAAAGRAEELFALFKFSVDHQHLCGYYAWNGHRPILQIKTPEAINFRCFGAPEGNRIPDLLLRRQLLYPTELRAHCTAYIITQICVTVKCAAYKWHFFVRIYTKSCKSPCFFYRDMVQ